VWQDSHVRAHKIEQMERGQDQRLMPLILETMSEAAIAFDALDRIAVTKGPGSFTGLRIGLAAARGIGLAAAKPVMGINRLMLYHHQYQSRQQDLLVILQSKRKELYCQFFPHGHEPHAPMMLDTDQITAFLSQHPDTLLVGDVQSSTLTIKPALENETITAALMAATADTNDAAFSPRPLYIRPPDVTIKAA
jgi:tRNA threonylcarbamoyladenosine biosynthesis protein TsaB